MAHNRINLNLQEDKESNVWRYVHAWEDSECSHGAATRYLFLHALVQWGENRDQIEDVFTIAMQYSNQIGQNIDVSQPAHITKKDIPRVLKEFQAFVHQERGAVGKVFDPKRISTQGTNFFLAAHRCSEQKPISPSSFQRLLIPENVCLAFSIELNTKAIICLEGNDPKDIHNIKKLIKSLKGKTQNTLISDTGYSKEKFWIGVTAIANAFEFWRYIYEQNEFNFNLDILNKLATACEKTANLLASQKS